MEYFFRACYMCLACQIFRGIGKSQSHYPPCLVDHIELFLPLGSSSRERHRILAAILDFVQKVDKHTRKNYRANFLGPICKLEINNNQSRGLWLHYQILMMAKMNKTEISAERLKRKEITKFLISESHQKLIITWLG